MISSIDFDCEDECDDEADGEDECDDEADGETVVDVDVDVDVVDDIDEGGVELLTMMSPLALLPFLERVPAPILPSFECSISFPGKLLLLSTSGGENFLAVANNGRFLRRWK